MPTTALRCLCMIAAAAAGSAFAELHTQNARALRLLDGLLRKYDRRSTPTDNMGIATNVSLELYVASLSSINTENMDYETDTYLRQQWWDSRLAHPNLTSALDLADPRLVKAIWKPEVFFPNAKEADFQFVTVPNVLIRIHPNGEILYILRLRLKFSCMMELSRYPLDSQICGMQVASFSKETRELQLFWSSSHTPVTVAADLQMPQFSIQKVKPTTCNNQFHLGNYSCLVAEFHMKRSISFHLIQSYLPSTLTVFVSWVSFWMDIESVPGRISLGVVTLLAMSSQAGQDKNVPQTSYVKAIDVWLGLCMAFVFAALVEFTIVNFWFRKSRGGYRKLRGTKGRRMTRWRQWLVWVGGGESEEKGGRREDENDGGESEDNEDCDCDCVEDVYCEDYDDYGGGNDDDDDAERRGRRRRGEVYNCGCQELHCGSEEQEGEEGGDGGGGGRTRMNANHQKVPIENMVLVEMAENGGAAKSSLAGNHVDTEISGGNGNGNSTAANLVQFAVQDDHTTPQEECLLFGCGTKDNPQSQQQPPPDPNPNPHRNQHQHFRGSRLRRQRRRRRHGGSRFSRRWSHPAELVDQACRKLFPLGFLACNAVYWIYYLDFSNIMGSGGGDNTNQTFVPS